MSGASGKGKKPMSPRAEFPSTIWTAIQAAPEKARASVCNLYRAPVLSYLLARGVQAEDAEDLTQEVFLRVCGDGFLEKVAPSKGRFRALLLAVARNVLLKAAERKHRRREVPIDPESDVPVGPAEPDERFDRLWRQNLVREALKRLEAEGQSGGPPYAAVIKHVKINGLSYAEAATKLKAEVGDVTNWVFHGKQRMRFHLRELVMEYCSTAAEYKDEQDLVLSDFR